jgi:hypothetical protein
VQLADGELMQSEVVPWILRECLGEAACGFLIASELAQLQAAHDLWD